MTLYIIILILILMLIVVILPINLVHFVSQPKKYTLEQSMKVEKGKDFWQNYDSYEKEEWNIPSFDGYLLHGNLIHGSSPQKFVIITHGYTYTRHGSIKYAHLFHQLGYQVYLYDLRHHGENAKTFCSMGDYESRDIVAIAEAIRKRFGNNITIGMHGESLGAASSIIAAGLDPNFSFLIEDCGFSNLGKLLEYQGSAQFHLPKFEVRLTSFFNGLIHKKPYDDINPIDSLQNAKLPILFIHGTDDTFIPCSMCKEMYEAYHGPKEIALFEGAEHAKSFETDRTRYQKLLQDFLEKYEK